MATRIVKLSGRLLSAASVDILWDGVSVASGAVTESGTPDEEGIGIIGEWTFEDNGATELTNHSLSISVTSGMISAGPMFFSADGINSDDPALGSLSITAAGAIPGTGYWIPYNNSPFGDGSDAALTDRTSILVNGVAPTLGIGETTTGTAENPTWAGWNWSLAAGEELTCTARVPANWTAYVAPV